MEHDVGIDVSLVLSSLCRCMQPPITPPSNMFSVANSVVVPFLIVVHHSAAAPLFQRQARLGAVERLELAFLVERQHDCMRGRINVETDDVRHFGGEPRIVGQHEQTHPMELQAVTSPNALHRTDADRAGSGHGSAGPLRGLAGRVGQRQRDNTFSHQAALSTPDTGLDVPVRRLISLVPHLSADSKTIRARQTCFCELF
jgi:hypothetical protein